MKHKPIRAHEYVVLELTKGYCAIIDRSSWPKVRKFSWHVHFSRGKNRAEGLPYARANIAGKKVYLHRFLTNCLPGLYPDHKNHQTLDCRIVNLEVVDHVENQRRRRNTKRNRHEAQAQNIHSPDHAN